MSRRHSYLVQDDLRVLDLISSDDVPMSRSDGAPCSYRFGRMFDLTPFDPGEPLLVKLAEEMARPQPAPNDAMIASGYTLLGQFITHDLTFDTTSLDDSSATSTIVPNLRTPRLDLDSVYGRSPGRPEDPPRNGARMAYTQRAFAEDSDDLRRRADGSAIIGDLRNDENLLISQLHLAFLKLHNALVDRIDPAGVLPTEDVFTKAQKECRWYFQWLVVNDYLPRIVRRSLLDEILVLTPGKPAQFNLKLYAPGDPECPIMPLEFAAAAFRFGHSMVRDRYIINRTGQSKPLFGSGSDHLGGGRPYPPGVRWQLDWSRFFAELPPSNGSDTFRRNHAKKLDSHLTPILADLPALPLEEGTTSLTASLALRDLKRGVKHRLASGQDVAEEVNKRVGYGHVLTNAQLGLLPPWGYHAPLWFYILKEAELCNGGQHLGDVGGRIVAEVILGLLKYDPTSYLNVDPGFTPTITGGPIAGHFTMADMLRLARVDVPGA